MAEEVDLRVERPLRYPSPLLKMYMPLVMAQPYSKETDLRLNISWMKSGDIYPSTTKLLDSTPLSEKSVRLLPTSTDPR